MNNSLAEPSSQSYEADSQMILYWHYRPLLLPGSHQPPRSPSVPVSVPRVPQWLSSPARSPLSFLLSYSSSTLTSLYFSFPSHQTGLLNTGTSRSHQSRSQEILIFFCHYFQHRVWNISRCLMKRLDLGQTFINTEVDLIILVSLFIYILIIIIWCR